MSTDQYVGVELRHYFFEENIECYPCSCFHLILVFQTPFVELVKQKLQNVGVVERAVHLLQQAEHSRKYVAAVVGSLYEPW